MKRTPKWYLKGMVFLANSFSTKYFLEKISLQEGMIDIITLMERNKPHDKPIGKSYRINHVTNKETII